MLVSGNIMISSDTVQERRFSYHSRHGVEKMRILGKYINVHQRVFPFNINARRKFLNDVPKSMYLELTTVCNLNCKVCPRESMSAAEKAPHHMSLSDLDTILEFAGAKDYRRIYISAGIGEPMLHKNFLLVLEKIQKAVPGVPVWMNSNGTVFSEAIIERIVDHNLLSRITYSLNCIRAHDYYLLTGKDVFDRVFNNLKMLMSARNGKSTPEVVISLLDFGMSDKDLSDFKEGIAPYLNEKDSIYMRPLHSWSGIVNDKEEKLRIKKGQAYPCLWLWCDATVIDSRGNVFGCCPAVVYPKDKNKLCFGSIFDSDIDQKRAAALKRLRRMHRRDKMNEINACKECSAFNTFACYWIKAFGYWF
jgi:sulfatase maturation enzyme AslB (radical SAM superfamily)